MTADVTLRSQVHPILRVRPEEIPFQGTKCLCTKGSTRISRLGDSLSCELITYASGGVGRIPEDAEPPGNPRQPPRSQAPAVLPVHLLT